jgi:hypothetical protein
MDKKRIRSTNCSTVTGGGLAMMPTDVDEVVGLDWVCFLWVLEYGVETGTGLKMGTGLTNCKGIRLRSLEEDFLGNRPTMTWPGWIVPGFRIGIVFCRTMTAWMGTAQNELSHQAPKIFTVASRLN